MIMALWDFLSAKLCAIEEAKTEYHCNHHNTRLVYIIQSNGAIQYKRQCLDCYQDASSFISHKKLSAAEKLGAVPRDDDKKFERSKSYYAERRKLQQKAFWQLYNEYLSSPEWREKRDRVLMRDRYTCKLKRKGCTHRAEQVHHLSYENVGNEPLEDLISACVNCHEIVTVENRQIRDFYSRNGPLVQLQQRNLQQVP